MELVSREILQRTPGKQSHSIVNRHSMVEIVYDQYILVCMLSNLWINTGQPTATCYQPAVKPTWYEINYIAHISRIKHLANVSLCVRR